ncbi:hypothetical protein [Sulfoacidibacillus ferrooxidans]|uniref:Uncharacterized protein n=1 Tax=Sulfoacidibacillus ferrooxidans TaxID=2005001 RepID=A0A9X1VCN3_9BACL|nr:hypothetical protein [Sulfoacidibacillus ferrooxidans]MCI0184909.1 hypothetical protein [Sulfoacidibacillus ferrooxidans]
MKTFSGRYIMDKNGVQESYPKAWTLQDVQRALSCGDIGMIQIQSNSGYTIDGHACSASGLSIGGGLGFPVEVNGQIEVATHFRRYLLPWIEDANDDTLERVLVQIDPEAIDFVSIVHEEDAQPQKQFIAVFSDGGIITTIKMGTDLRELILYMQTQCDDRFDPETDDARIFDSLENEVYVLPSPGALETENLGVYYCSNCQQAERVHVVQRVFCTSCGTRMERLDTLG